MRGGDRLPEDGTPTPHPSQERSKSFRCGFLARKSQEFIKRLSRQEKGKSCKVSLQEHFSAFPGIALQRRCRPRLGTTEGEDGEGGLAVSGGPRGSEGAGFWMAAWDGTWRPSPAGSGAAAPLTFRAPLRLPVTLP